MANCNTTTTAKTLMEANNLIEITFNGETTSVQLAPNASEDSWSLLEKLFRERFGIKDDEGAPKARYIDQEGDVVTLDSTEEPNGLIATASSAKPLHLTFSLAKGSEGTRMNKEEKRLCREEKKQARMARREERKKHREERIACKHASKEERCLKKQAREERLKQRLDERRIRKEQRAQGEVQGDNDPVEWPANASRLYLDGNNMMFVTGGLRSLTLKHSRGKAESLLAAAAESFITEQAGKISNAVLIFDNTRTDTTKTVAGTTFRICSARPHTPTSDEVLIAWAKEAQAKGESSQMVFVTSDRALREQLKEAGGILMKPKHFLYLTYHLAAHNNSGADLPVSESDLDAWLGSLL